METRHIRLGYDEALAAKKQLLSSELNTLQMIKKLKTYRLLRKKELAIKTKLKIELTSLKTKINLIQSTFPSEEKKIKTPKREKRILKEKKESIQDELSEIKSKLDKLK